MLDAIIIGDITDVEMVMKAHTKNGTKASIVFPVIDPDSLSIELSRVEMRGDVGNNVIETVGHCMQDTVQARKYRVSV
jgi:hypothetical protein